MRMEFTDIPQDILILIKKRLDNKSFREFNQTCSHVYEAKASRLDVCARKCGLYDKVPRKVFFELGYVGFRCGHLKCLKFLHRNLSAKERIRSVMACFYHVINQIVRKGYFKTMKYVFREILPVEKQIEVLSSGDADLLITAASRGYFKMVKYLYQMGTKYQLKNFEASTKVFCRGAFNAAIMSNDISTVRFFLQNGCTLNHLHTTKATRHIRKVSFLKYLLSIGFNIKESLEWILYNAIRSSNFKLLEYLGPKYRHTYSFATVLNRMHSDVCLIRKDDIRLVKYFKRYHPTGNLGRILEFALRMNRSSKFILQILDSGIRVKDLRVSNYYNFRLCIGTGRLDIVKKCFSLGLGVEDIKAKNNAALSTAAASGHYKILRFLLDKVEEFHEMAEFHKME